MQITNFEQSISQVINKGIDFLIKEQQKDGSFLVLLTPDHKGLQIGRNYQTVFSTCLILQSLNALAESPTLVEIKKKAVDFLLSQKSEYWTFNYWSRRAPEFKTIPYPEDLDDTASALTALFEYNPKIIDGEVLGKFVTILTSLEQQEGGPYRTWLVQSTVDKAWQDIDLAVNSNIAYFLALQEVDLPNLATLAEKAIETKNFSSPYYISPYSTIYFISRFYKGSKTQELIDFLWQKQDSSNKWDNPLDTALAILALLNLKTKPEKLISSIEYLLKSRANGSWEWQPLYIDKGKTYAGSPALTTSFCLQALHKFQIITKAPTNLRASASKQDSKIDGTQEEDIYEKIILKAKNRFALLEPDLQNQAFNMLTKMIKGDKDKQIILLPYLFKTALGANAQNISEEMVIQLGLANLYGWTAYTIYDDFLDEEGNPPLLPMANVLLRDLTIIFNNILPPSSGFPQFFQKIMDKLDSANTWETSHCRIKATEGQIKMPGVLPDYGDYTILADRSLGHSLGSIAILFALGYKSDSDEVISLWSFFKYFLSARQLNDDAHDWQKDLEQGQINSAASALLAKWQEKTPAQNQQGANISNIIPDLQKLFWYEVIPGLCQTILKHTKLAQESLMSLSPITNPEVLTNLLKREIRSAQKALTERAQTLKFLKSYKL